MKVQVRVFTVWIIYSFQSDYGTIIQNYVLSNWITILWHFILPFMIIDSTTYYLLPYRCFLIFLTWKKNEKCIILFLPFFVLSLFFRWWCKRMKILKIKKSWKSKGKENPTNVCLQHTVLSRQWTSNVYLISLPCGTICIVIYIYIRWKCSRQP